MAASKVLTIGSIIKHRGEYSSSTVYYINNQITMYNCVFQAIGNNFSGVAPITVASDGTISLANTTTWKCIIDNVALYNAALSTNNVEKRVTVVEGEISGIKTASASAEEKAASALTTANSASDKVTVIQNNLDEMGKEVKANATNIEANANAIKALQEGVSSLSFEWTGDDSAKLTSRKYIESMAIPFSLKDAAGSDIASDSTYNVTVTCYDGTAVTSKVESSSVVAAFNKDGVYTIKLIATYHGQSINVERKFYVMWSISIAGVNSDTTEVIENNQYFKDAPFSFTFNVPTGKFGIIINIPNYLIKENAVLTCSGLPVPCDISVGEEDTAFDLAEELRGGEYTLKYE